MVISASFSVVSANVIVLVGGGTSSCLSSLKKFGMGICTSDGDSCNWRRASRSLGYGVEVRSMTA